MNYFSDQRCVLLKQNLRLFNFLEPQDIELLSEYLACASINAGETLWRQGEHGDFEALILEGEVAIQKQTEFPGRHITVGIYSSGSLVGELCLIDGLPRAVTAVARKDTSLLILKREQFDTLLADQSQLAVKFLKGMLLTISIRLRKSFDRLTAHY